MKKLEGIINDAEICAENCWWKAHDNEDWLKVRKDVKTTELILLKYTASAISSDKASSAFMDALQAYDNYTGCIKMADEPGLGSRETNVSMSKIERDIQEHLEHYYSALNMQNRSSELANATTS